MQKIKMANFYITLVIALLFVMLYTTNKSSMQKFNNNFIDMYFNIRGELSASLDIVIIDIDEISLQTLGHWPWRRDKIAKIVENLTADGVGVIGFDMVFAEEDDASPAKVAKEYNLSLKNPIDYDEIFAKSIASSPSILGYVLNMEQNYTNTNPNVNAIFIEKNRPKQAYLPHAYGVTANIPLLQEAAYSSGSFNMFPDADGVVRSVPLLIEYDGVIYPSLSLEILRVALGASTVEVNYDAFGVDTIMIGDISIPTDAHGQLFVNFAGAKNSYRYISALDIYEGKVKKEDIEGKIALLGTSAAGLLDLRAMPFDKMIPGVEIHANVMDNIMHENFLQKPSNSEGINILMILFSTLMAGVILTLFSPFVALSFSFGFLALFHYGLYTLMFQEGVILNIIYPTLSIVSVILALFFSNLFYESRQKERILGKFAKKVSPAVAEALIKSGNVDFKANEREVSIFFSDIRSFTSISEGFSSAHDLIDYLNDYMSPMSDIIIKNAGTIDKYIGDAIMAYWNAPLDVKHHADMAVTSAIEQIEALESLNEKLKKDALPEIKIGIGIHTGDVVVGEMGSHDRSDYTIIGDTVNLGSRVEGLCKVYASEILISEVTKASLVEQYKLREIDSVLVKGKEKPVTLFSVLGFGVFDAYELEREERYTQALLSYKEGAYEKAQKAFLLLYEHYHDRLFLFYHDRCVSLAKGEIKLENGVFKHVEK